MSLTVVVCYVIQGDEEDPETGVQSSFRVERPIPPRALTLYRLKEMFPFVGTFHFRLKIADDSGLSDFCWVDLSRDGEDILQLAKNLGGVERSNDGEPRLHLKVLPIDFGGPSEGGVAGEGLAGAFPRETAGSNTAFGGGETRVGDDLAGGVAGMDLGDGSRGVHANVTFNTNAHEVPPHEERDPPPPFREEMGGGFDRAAERRDSVGDYGDDDDDDDEGDGDKGGEGRGSGEDDHYGGGGGGGGVGQQTTADDDFDAFVDEDGVGWKSSVETRFQSGLSDLQKKSAQVAKTVGSGAKKWFNIINKGVGGAQLPSEEALENLHGLSRMLGTPFSAKNLEHVADVRKVWDCLFPDDEFVGVESERWKEAGFREAKVIVDFRGTGVLMAKGLAFFCQHYGRKARTQCRAQAGADASRYPWAVVANNVTLMLVQVLELRADRFAASRANYWGVLERPDAYFQIFCMAFALFDHTWITRRAKRNQFEEVIEHTKEVVEHVLGSSPPDLDAFMREAEEMGMLRL